jgi:citrate lyase subunit beta/citryl-CoA lyase
MKPLTYASGPAYLFCPASRPDRYQKALDAADFAIFDLEDAVAPADKAAARQALINNPVDPDAVIVRVNAIGTPDHALDLEALEHTEYGRIMLPKAEDPEAIAKLDRFEVIALCETARGVLRAPDIAEVPCVVALMWGAEDLVASIGGRTSRGLDGRYGEVARHARARTLLGGAAAGRPVLDAVLVNYGDDETLRIESEEAAASGFLGKACVHPRQVAEVRASFVPRSDLISWARQVVESTDGGVASLGGLMVDEPVLAQARNILAALARSQPGSTHTT